MEGGREDVEEAISNLHKLISQSETGLQLMRAEVSRLESLVDEPPEPQAAAAYSKLTTSSSVQM